MAASLRKRERKRETDVTGATYYDEIEGNRADTLSGCGMV
jgi:hypothetical protein